MRSELDHLPEQQQNELARLREIVLEEFDTAISRASHPHRRYGKIYKIILFGSYARNDWVDAPDNGYQSDFDLLIVVSHEDLADIADYWHDAEDRIARDPGIARPVNIIVHSLSDVNNALARGEYFWTDIARDGVALYELTGHVLARPMPLTPRDAYLMASEHYERWAPSADQFIVHGNDAADRGWASKAAFEYHQATERLYICFLLVSTLYFPRSHNVKFLRSLAEDKDVRLVKAWPRDAKVDRSRFERLKRAYVEARYSATYAITAEDLRIISININALRDIVSALSVERLNELQALAEASGS